MLERDQKLLDRDQKIKLYTYWRSSTCYRVRIALNLKGLDFQSKPVHLIKNGGENWHKEFLAVNPQGLIPALVDKGTVITQSMAIIEYLDECYPDYPLLPKDIQARAYVRSLAQIIACEIHPLDNLRVIAYLQKKIAVDEGEKSDWYLHWIREGFKAFEIQLKHHSPSPFCFSEQAGLADLFLIPQIYNARRFQLDMSDFPRLSEIERNCLALDAFMQAMPENQPDVEY